MSPAPNVFPTNRKLAWLALALAPAAAALAGPLVSLDFESAPSAGSGASPALAGAGTIDSFMGAPGRALAPRTGLSLATTGRIPFSNTERDLARLTLGFDLRVGSARPVRVVVASFAADGRRTGSRAGVVVPPVAGSYYRFGLDLDQTRPLDGDFDPLAPFVEFTFAFETSADDDLRIDNLSYTAPAYYVSPEGSDTADGRTPATAFATPQHAADLARAGDVVLLMNGTYRNLGAPDIADIPKEVVDSPNWRPWWVEKTGGIVTIKNAGTPAAWIVFRAHPGHRPVLHNDGGWQAVKLDLTAAYIELRGLVIQGNRATTDLADALADGAIGERDGKRYHGDARFSGNAIMADGRPGQTPDHRPHHLRFIDNILFDNGGAGASIIGAEYITFEGNHTYDNCHTMRYASSGLSTLLNWNWDAGVGHKIFFVRNVSHGNETRVPWGRFLKDKDGRPIPNKLSDGNGIIVDVNQNKLVSTAVDYEPYVGRTLVQNNLCYNNGGSGIHTVNADHVDIVHNTAVLNSAAPGLQYSQIYTYGSNDVRIANNILVAPVADLAAGEKPEPVNQIKGRNADVVFSHNLYFGGNIPPDLGEGDRVADPRFVRLSRDPAVADFHLLPDSPARDTGAPTNLVQPLLDLDRRPRPQGPASDLGAYELPAAR